MCELVPPPLIGRWGQTGSVLYPSPELGASTGQDTCEVWLCLVGGWGGGDGALLSKQTGIGPEMVPAPPHRQTKGLSHRHLSSGLRGSHGLRVTGWTRPSGWEVGPGTLRAAVWPPGHGGLMRAAHRPGCDGPEGGHWRRTPVTAGLWGEARPRSQWPGLRVEPRTGSGLIVARGHDTSLPC